MPRTKEAIAILRGYAKFQGKDAGPNNEHLGDMCFAKGILAALRWMTDENSPIPYAELTEDLPDDGGWEESVPFQPGQKFIPVQPQLKNKVNLPEYTPPPQGTPPPEEPSRIILPGSFEAEASKHPWVRQLGNELVDLQGGTPASDRNAVIVGQGLNDQPFLAGGGEGY